MSMDQMVNPTLQINNVTIAYENDSLEYDPGDGEQVVRSVPAGGGNVEQIYADNPSTHVGSLKFELPSTHEYHKLVRDWKANANRNTATLTDTSPNGNKVSLTFNRVAFTAKLAIAVGTEKTIPCSFEGNSAI